jgi:hypothetical protein
MFSGATATERCKVVRFMTAVTAMAVLVAFPEAAAAEAGARGAPLRDVIIGGGLVNAIGIAALIVGIRHRRRPVAALAALARGTERVTGMPAWSSLPVVLLLGALAGAGIGFYWDVATHIDNGRDVGPFANDSHFLILGGLLMVSFAGWVSIVFAPRERFSGSVRLRADWHVPIGALMLLTCGFSALLGFPLDDAWHRVFGQDVTLWGPTHVLMIAGGSLGAIGVWTLLVEGWRQRPPSTRRGRRAKWFTEASLAGGWLVAASALHAEFEYGIPQFQLLFHPILIALSGAIGLVVARMRLGKGGALTAALLYCAFMGVFSLWVGPITGHTTLHFPLYVAEALLVEAVFWSYGRRAPLRVGALAGAAIGSAGIGVEWAWTHVWMPIPWPANLLPEALLLSMAAGVAGGTLAAGLATALAGRRPKAPHPPRAPLALAGVAVVAVLAIPLPNGDADGTRAQLTLTPVGGDLETGTIASGESTRSSDVRSVRVEVQLDPKRTVDDARWFNITAWQGGGSRIVEMQSLGSGRYRSASPVPVGGSWKTVLRLHRGSQLVAAPIYLPADTAIPAPAAPARRQIVRSFVPDAEVLQREAVGGTDLLRSLGYLLLGLIAAAWIGVIVWGLARLYRTREDRSAAPPRPTRVGHRERAAA